MHQGDKYNSLRENERYCNERITTLGEVTQDLTSVVKLLQSQLNDIKNHRDRMLEVPSSLMQPKTKEFFKSPPTTQNISSKISKPTNKNLSNQILDPKNSKSINKNPTNQILTPKNSKSINKNITPKSSNLTKNSSQIVPKMGQPRSSILSTISNKKSTTPLSPKVSSLSKRSSYLAKKNSSASAKCLPINDPLLALKAEVQKAIRDRKTFTIRGQYRMIRRALLERGWVERFHVGYKDQINEELKRYPTYSIQELLELSRKQNLAETCKNLIKSKLLGTHQVDLYWGVNEDAYKDNPDKNKLTLMNKLKRDIFSYTTKQGLCEANKISHWYQQKNVSQLNHPRDYTLGKNGDLKNFIEDFRITAAMSLLKWVVDADRAKVCKLISPCGNIPIEVFDFAINECCKLLKKLNHEDIDFVLKEATEIEWNQFLEFYYKIVHYANHFRMETITEQSMIAKSNYVLAMLKEKYAYLDMDGYMNIWMLKPVASSRGRGIHICRTLAFIIKTTKANYNTRYIVQKYIERPLLIHSTKFDIRQWFLISSTTPLTIWIYKDCYLRFSSQTYSLRKLHESIHLTNNSVQAKYKKNTSIDAALPSYYMWDSKEFENYLTSIGYPVVFKEFIYPQMKENITAAVLMHQDKMVARRNSFELFGADFILTEDFRPWLLEINSNPAMYSSTPVTARLCPQVLEDVIKVVIDYARNSKSKTGEFELIYKEKELKLPPPSDLTLSGCSLPPNYFFSPEMQAGRPHPIVFEPINKYKNGETLNEFGANIKKTLKNLLEIIHKERTKRELKHKNVCTIETPQLFT